MPVAAADPRDEFGSQIDLEAREASRLPEVDPADVGIEARSDLQRCVEDPTELVGPDLLLVTTEFERSTPTREHPVIPHTLALKPGLVVDRTYNGYWFWGLREAWGVGDVSRFHGWDEPAATSV
jgi:hypothetical protein